MLTMKDIVREGHPSLREVAEEVKLPPTEEELTLLEDMHTFLKNSQDEKICEQYKLRPGVGLAAPQLGINKRMVAIHFEDHHGKLYSYQLINPKVVSHSVEKAYLGGGEGCLSVDRAVEGYVPRYARVTVKAMSPDGQPMKLRLRDYAAIVFQHEIDHLNGIMFYDHINKENPYLVPEQAKVIE
ncbi:peptide deformylase [Ornithinibacillus gellani]|uniref:peptide deformylase n=1 Tax=Ornithinibacillus gellani TaxID=2293253 RepID=UPI000F46C4F8|nr:peptide deformylase [Ornithinibacillus gellani]TQS75709.1 peptide deformylase [Ornithinibacillus gellani]